MEIYKNGYTVKCMTGKCIHHAIYFDTIQRFSSVKFPLRSLLSLSKHLISVHCDCGLVTSNHRNVNKYVWLCIIINTLNVHTIGFVELDLMS